MNLHYRAQALDDVDKPKPRWLYDLGRVLESCAPEWLERASSTTNLSSRGEQKR